jgi:hypothetical protein
MSTQFSSVNADVSQGSAPGPLLHLLYTADLPTSPESITATFADDTAVIQPLHHTNCKPTYLQSKTGWKMGNESERIQVNPRHIHHTKRNVPPGPYKQCVTPPRWWCEVSRATPWQETYLAQTHFCKTETIRNNPQQNVLVTWKQVKALCKQQTCHI